MTTDDEEPGVPDSPLDELFVEGARYREPSAAERAEWAKQQRKELDEAKKRRQKEERRAKRTRPGGDPSAADSRAEAAASRTRRPLLAIALLAILTITAYLLFGRSDDKKSGAAVIRSDRVAMVSVLDYPAATTA